MKLRSRFTKPYSTVSRTLASFALSPPPSTSLDIQTHYDLLLKTSCHGVSSLKQIHSSLTTRGLTAQSLHLTAQIILKYSKFNCPADALSLFSDVNLNCGGKPSSFLWNTMLRAHVNAGQFPEAAELYSIMRKNRVLPDNYTYPFVLRACPQCGRMVHGEAVKTGFDSDVYVGAALVDSYARCGWLDDARKVFDGMAERDLVCWTAMMGAYEQAGQVGESLALFSEMQRKEGGSVDSVMVVTVASAIGQVGDHRTAKSLHAYALRNGIFGDICLGNSLIAMYAKCGNVVSARILFDVMDEKDGISWNSILSSYIQNGQSGEALKLFEQMEETGHRPDPVTMLIIVSACSVLSSRNLGRKIHNLILVWEMKINAQLWNALMDMYVKCGDLEMAIQMFDEIPLRGRDVYAWNVMISGHGMHGRAKEALCLYSRMLEENISPDHVTFLSLLSSCSHCGLIEEGHECFEDMKKFSITPQVKHYACMVDMLGRAGLLHEALGLIREMPFEPNDEVWGAFLLACEVHGNVKLGHIAANNLFQLQPDHPGYYILMSNICAGSREWHKAGELRQDIRSRGLRKPTGLSASEYANKDNYEVL